MRGRSEDGPKNGPHFLVLGEVLRPHGLRGDVRMRVLTDFPERIAELEVVYVGRDPNAPEAEAYAVECIRVNQGFALLKLAGIDDRTQADLLRERFVMVDIGSAVPLEDDEVYLYQLIGLQVQIEAGERLGTLVEVLETGANDVYIVDSPRYGEVLIPATDETILETDPAAGLMIVRLPEGLLPNAG